MAPKRKENKKRSTDDAEPRQENAIIELIDTIKDLKKEINLLKDTIIDIREENKVLKTRIDEYCLKEEKLVSENIEIKKELDIAKKEIVKCHVIEMKHILEEILFQFSVFLTQ